MRVDAPNVASLGRVCKILVLQSTVQSVSAMKSKKASRELTDSATNTTNPLRSRAEVRKVVTRQDRSFRLERLHHGTTVP